jgi:hypothetical protein
MTEETEVYWPKKQKYNDRRSRHILTEETEVYWQETEVYWQKKKKYRQKKQKYTDRKTEVCRQNKQKYNDRRNRSVLTEETKVYRQETEVYWQKKQKCTDRRNRSIQTEETEVYWQKKQKYSETDLSQRHFVRHRSHADWPEIETGLRGEMPVINRLSRGTDMICFTVVLTKQNVTYWGSFPGVNWPGHEINHSL